MIGVIAGVGPFAGLDLQHKIARQTIARADQDHLTVISISQPSTIPDRTAFLAGETPLNPAHPIIDQLHQLEQSGAVVAAIPCNTAHAPAIFDVIGQRLAASGSRLRLLHMINEVGQMLLRHYSSVQKVGVLSTIGTAAAGVYPIALEPMGFEVLTPSDRLLHDKIHPAIYDEAYGIKACGYASDKARRDLLDGVDALRNEGAQAVILGCTELPLAFPEKELDGLPLIDSTWVLARSLIRAVDPQKLRPFTE